MTTGGFFRPFRNRAEAGEQLGAALERRRRDGSIVLGIPRGGVEVGLLVAEALEAADGVEVIHAPDRFEAVAQYYEHWADLTDQDVVKLVGGSRPGAGFARWPAG